MQYNIYRISKKELLLKEMIEKNYSTNNKIVKSGNFNLTLYYSKRENSSISWQKVLNEFDISIQIDKDSLKGILIAESDNSAYAVTYGMSSSLVQKYCDSEFPMDIAKRIEVSKVKRKAAKILNGSTNGLVKTLSNTNLIVVDKGESVVNLELIPDEEEQLGKCIGIGKSVKINVDNELESFSDIIDILEAIEKRKEKRPIPLFVPVKNEELINNIWEYLNTDFINRINNLDFSLDEMNILGSSIYFDDAFRIELYYLSKHEEIPFLNTYYVRDFIEKNQIDVSKAFNYMKVKYISDDGFNYVKSFRDVLTFDFKYNEEKYVIYDGNIYYYNDDFYKNIISGINTITFEKYDALDDKSKEWYIKYLEENDLCDVKDKNKDKTNSTYREKVINEVLAKKYDYDNLDRNLIKICKEENYKIEIADLGKKDDVLYAVKVGTPRDFCYAIDQSNLTLDAFISNENDLDDSIDKYKGVKRIGLWLYVTGKKKFYNEKNEVDIMVFDSIMFLNKLVEWAAKVISYGYKPIIKINYYHND